MSNAYARAVQAHAAVESRAVAKAESDLGLPPAPPLSVWQSSQPSKLTEETPTPQRHLSIGSSTSFSFHYGNIGIGNPSLPSQQPSSPYDPVNWSWAKKHAVFLSLIPGSLLSDWTLTWGTTVFQLQAPEWHMTVEAVAQSVSPGIFMQGPGGIVAVPLCQRFGRLPVLFWSQLLCLVFTIGAMHAATYNSFTAMRALQGFFGAAPQVIGLSIIHDMFSFAERTRKINIWAGSFLLGPYLGPFISSLLLLRLDWRSDFGVLAGFYALSFAMVLVLGDETLFDRQAYNPLHDEGEKTSLPAWLSLPTWVNVPTWVNRPTCRRFKTLVGVEGYRGRGARPSLWTIFRDMASLLTRPNLFFPTALFVTPITMWTIGAVSTIAQFVLPPEVAGGYAFSYVGLAMLYWAPMLGTLAAELWGHWFNDEIARRYMERFGPECRLTAAYPAVTIGVLGLIVFGQTLQHHLSWAGIAFGWAMLCFCTLTSMTAVSAYMLDCFPRHAALAAAWINFWRVIGGFTVVYFQHQWVQRSGAAATFGGQAVVISVAALSVGATQWWGRMWRERYPAPPDEN